MSNKDQTKTTTTDASKSSDDSKTAKTQANTQTATSDPIDSPAVLAALALQEMGLLDDFLSGDPEKEAEEFAALEALWDDTACSKFSPRLGTAMLFIATEMKPDGAKVVLQKTLGVAIDKDIGPVTLGAINDQDEFELLTALFGWHIRRSSNLPNAFTELQARAQRAFAAFSAVLAMEVKDVTG